ncbi:MAG: 3'-5' exonuclease [Sandaracinaceae bacterium]
MTAYDALVVLDFEATCVEGGAPDPQEIIELPSVLVSLSERRVVDEFGSFVRPVHHPTLSPFCTQLTSITQRDVDGAPTFVEVLAAHRAWLASHDLFGDPPRFAFVTCGDWDLLRMLPRQLATSSIDPRTLPEDYRRWINVKEVFTTTLAVRRAGGMTAMLETLKLPLEGRHHRGIDDCRNIARIVLALAAKGASFAFTRRVDLPDHA